MKLQEKTKKRAILVAAILMISSGTFLFGVSTGHYKHVPYDQIQAVKGLLVPSPPPRDSQDLLDTAFTGGIPRYVPPLLLPEIDTMEELSEQVSRLKILSNEAFVAGARMPRPAEATVQDDVLNLTYRIDGELSQTYAYFRPAASASNCAALVVPGSGDHQSSQILLGRGYHGSIADTTAKVCDTYILIKPNQDVRAIHRGGRSLDPNHLYVHLLNEGFSYSATYLLEAIAVMEWLEGTYSTTGVVGLSQGGYAALIVSSRTRADFAVVASGFTVRMDEAIFPAAADQITVPGMFKAFGTDAVGRHLANTTTEYLFSYGRAETGIYGLEARDQTTCAWLGQVAPNTVSCVVHDGGHQFPTQEVAEFLAEHA